MECCSRRLHERRDLLVLVAWDNKMPRSHAAGASTLWHHPRGHRQVLPGAGLDEESLLPGRNPSSRPPDRAAARWIDLQVHAHPAPHPELSPRSPSERSHAPKRPVALPDRRPPAPLLPDLLRGCWPQRRYERLEPAREARQPGLEVMEGVGDLAELAQLLVRQGGGVAHHTEKSSIQDLGHVRIGWEAGGQ